MYLLNFSRYFIIGSLLTLLLPSCSNKPKDEFLIKVTTGNSNDFDARSGYVNEYGDTVVPAGKYLHCYTDTLKRYAIVLTKQNECIAIDKNDKKLFNVFWYDNGPDYVVDGLFRIVEHEKIGYANTEGEIIIQPQYSCAYPFKGGKAKVSTNCQTIKEDEHHRWKSDTWFFIDKNGKIINE